MNTKQKVPLRHSIRIRFLLLTLGLVFVSVVLVAYLGTNAVFQAGESAGVSTEIILRNQVEDYLIGITVATAAKNDLALEGIRQDAVKVAALAARIFESPEAYSRQNFWSAADSMFFGEANQYINGENDISTVFVPNTVTIDDGLIKELELSAYLDNIFPAILESHSDAVAIYYIGQAEFSRLYPNINLGTLLPPDYLATQDIFFSIGNPENNPNRETVWTPVYDDPAGQGFLISAIAPIYTSEDTFLGIIGIDVSLQELANAIESTNTVAEGYTILMDGEGRALAMPDQGFVDLLNREPLPGEAGADLNDLNNDFNQVIQEMKKLNTGFSRIFVNDREFLVAYTSLPSTEWALASIVQAEGVYNVITQLQTELREASQNLVQNQLIPFGLVLLVVMLILGFIIINQLMKPIQNLVSAAEQVQAGNWNVALPPASKDEVGLLTNAFRAMLEQLRNLFGNLEQRVGQRTQELRLASEVGQALASVQDLDTLLSSAVELIRERFGLYYVQIYLVESTRQTLILRSGSGSVGAELHRRSHRLPIGTGSINGRAAAERRAIVVSDTASSTTFRANPLLTDTRSEIAMPLLYADQVIGVIDLQSSVPNSLNTELLPTLEVLAGQLAIAITNARLYERMRQAQSEMTAQTRSLTHQGWQEFLDAVERSEHIGYAYDQGILREVKERTLLEQGDGKLGVPIMVGAESIGTIQLERDAGFDWSESDEELVHTVANRVAQQMETLRVLAQAEGYRANAEAATRRLTREGWEQFRGTTQLSEVYYNSSEVVPLKGADVDINQTAFTHTLSSHNQKIGELKILGIEELEPTDVDLVSKVAERLAIHLENLRLNEQTQTALTATSALYEGSERIVNASSMDEILQALIQSSKLSKMTRSHIYFFDQPWEISMPNFMTSVATWASEGESPEPIGTSYPLSDYPFLHGMSRSEPFIALDLVHDPRVDTNTRKVLDELDLKGMMVFPMLAAGQWVGAIFGEATSKVEFPREEIQQIEALVGQAGTVAQNLRLIEQTRAVALRERNLRQITAVVRNATSPDAILRTAARELGSAIGRKVVIQLGLQQGTGAEAEETNQPSKDERPASTGLDS